MKSASTLELKSTSACPVRRTYTSSDTVEDKFSCRTNIQEKSQVAAIPYGGLEKDPPGITLASASTSKTFVIKL